MYQKVCNTVCPEGYTAEISTGTCRVWHLSDIGLVYFPFLCTGSIFAILIFIGRYKKKAILVKGKIHH